MSSCCGDVSGTRFVGVPGPPGPAGPPGNLTEADLAALLAEVGAAPGAEWFFGEGAPTAVVGSKPGDVYMDVLTGTIYKWEK